MTSALSRNRSPAAYAGVGARARVTAASSISAIRTAPAAIARPRRGAALLVVGRVGCMTASLSWRVGAGVCARVDHRWAIRARRAATYSRVFVAAATMTAAAMQVAR